MEKVLLIDDDVELRNLLEEYLLEEGFSVSTASDGRAAMTAIADPTVDSIVRDVMIPHKSGIEVLQSVRKRGAVPVLMLTARSDDVDRIAGLDLGADDYVSKPCSPGELAARLRAILRRTKYAAVSSVESSVLSVGKLAMYPGNRSAEWNGRPLDLTGTEFSVLEVLAANAGRLVSKQEISKRAFGKPLTPFDRRIDVHLSSVRQKLGTRPDGQSWIQSVRGQGYQLMRD